ncbi:MAG: hypothetical protein IPJ40_21870 [Saprospirales bacterium]|nr:hypothetical protein [Saprospirales bacterium]
MQWIGKQAIRADIDYYALRYRMGEAAFKQRKYWNSIRHFEKTLHFNSADPYAQEYLFYSYWYTGRPSDAWLRSKQFGPGFLKQHQLSRSQWLEYINMEGGVKISNIIDIHTLGYGTFGVGHRPGLRWSYFHAINHVQQQFLADQITQTDYFGILRFQAAKGLGVYLSGRYLQGQIDRNVAAFENGFPMRINTQILQQGWTAMGGLELSGGRWTVSPFLGRSYTPVQTRTMRTTFGGNGNIMGKVLTDTTKVISTWQGGVDFLYWLHPAIRVGFQPNALVQNGSVRYFFGAQLQWIPTNRWSFGVHYLHEPLQDYLESGGAVFDNSISILHQRWRGQTAWQVSKRVQLYGIYQWENREFDGQPIYYNTFITGIKFIL